ncbi:hypothetical protein PN36_34785, partial [Candidatus Thiomargarita nelsonii]
ILLYILATSNQITKALVITGNVPTDANGDIAITVTSNFFIAKTPLVSSVYSADFLVSVTAQ